VAQFLDNLEHGDLMRACRDTEGDADLDVLRALDAAMCMTRPTPVSQEPTAAKGR
jgi:hypothetical protein